jgi:hypothetical protein
LLFTKSSEWEYENELRLIKPDIQDREVNFNKDSLVEIIFGVKATNKDIQDVINICSEFNIYANVKFMKAVIEKNEFKLKLEEVRRT